MASLLIERIKKAVFPISDRFSTIFEVIAYGPTDTGRRAIVPEWYWYAPYGQPRNVDIDKIRELARTPFVDLCVTTIVDEFAATPWHVVPKDKMKFDQKHIDILNEFLNKPNQNKETLADIMRQWGRDILTIDAGVIVKVFTEDSYEGEYNPASKKYVKKEISVEVEENIYHQSGKKDGEIKEIKLLEKGYHPLTQIGK